jgi:uncharacterized protein GlcG (DUF336 family)
LTSAEADSLVQAAPAVGAERGFPRLAVAVVDLTGEVVVVPGRRRDADDQPHRVAKARTALLVDSIQHLYGGDFVPWAGGVRVTDGDVILGAAGASGAHAVEDEEAVRAAVRRGQEGRSG